MVLFDKLYFLGSIVLVIISNEHLSFGVDLLICLNNEIAIDIVDRYGNLLVFPFYL